jgi:hypothetical protein
MVSSNVSAQSSTPVNTQFSSQSSDYGSTPQENPVGLSFDRLPPTERDFAAFEAVVMDSRSTRDVSRELGISQTRVCQLVERVWQWHREVLPQIDRDFPLGAAQHAARLLAADRLDHLYYLAIRGFEHSKRDIVKTRVNASGDETSITTNHSGDVRYLRAALQITVAHAKADLPRGLVLESQALAADALDAIAGVDKVENHPVGDCTQNAERGVGNAESRTGKNVASSSTPKHSKRHDRLHKRAREKFFGPVHPGSASGADSPGSSVIAQLSLSPDMPGAKLEMLDSGPRERQSA